MSEQVKIDEEIKVDISEPGYYNVIFLNDDVTPMDWVVKMLMEIFHHSEGESMSLTEKIHTKGSAVVGNFMFEIAEQKMNETMDMSRKYGFPLQVEIQQE